MMKKSLFTCISAVKVKLAQRYQLPLSRLRGMDGVGETVMASFIIMRNQ